MANWFEENDPAKQDWFTANAPGVTPTAGELSTLEAPEGSPQREDINRGVAGNLFAPPGVFARDPTLSELINASMPRGVQEAQRDERRIPLAPPLPEQGRFEQGGIFGLAGAIEEAARTPSPEWMRPAEEWARTPLLHQMSREERTKALGYDPGPLPEEYLPEGKTREVVGGLREAGAGFIEGLSSPAMIALTVATAGSGAAGRIAAGTFAAQMASQTPELWREFNEAQTLQEKTKIAATAVATIGAAALGAKHALKGGIETPSRAGLRTEPLAPEPPVPGAQPGAVRPSAPYQTYNPDWFKAEGTGAPAEEPLAPVTPEVPPAPEAAPPLDDLIKQVQSMPTNKYAGYDFTPEQIAEIEARQAAEAAPPATPPVTPEEILARRKGILDRKKELEARAANGEQVDAQLAAVQADLLDPSNPVVHPPPPETPTSQAPATNIIGGPAHIQPTVQAVLNYRASGSRLSYVRLVDGSEHRVQMPFPVSGEDILLPDGSSIDPSLVTHVLDENRQPISGIRGLEAPPEGPPPPATAPEPYTPEAAAARAAQPEVTGISKADIAEQREARELPAIERQKQIDFGESLDRAKATLAQDPMAGQRLVEELSAKPRAVNPEDTPLLIERMQQVQRDFDAANRAVNEAAPEQLEVAKARLEHARTEYDKTVTATQNATSRTGAGLGSLNMILKEDYSLARMESRKRAANNGRISSEQKAHTEALHASIAELSGRLDRLEKQRSGGFRASDVGKEATAARKSGKRLTDYTGEAAQRARERINRQLHGLGAKPAPPTLLYDYAVVGADHLARGLTKFHDWSAQMIKEFGEKVKPHLQDLWKMARAVHDSTAKAFRTPEEVRLERYKTGLAKQTVGVTAKIQRGDFTKATRQPMALDTAAYKMKGNLQRLKNEFERGVAKDAYNKMSPADKFWQHFIGVERNVGKLSSPGVFEKLGLAAAVREVLAPVEAGGGYAVSKVFPRLAKGTKYGADLRTIARAEIKAKAAFFTEGMKDSWENFKGKETTLEAMSDKYGRQPDFWYNRIGKIHAAVKAPVKRAEFVRSLEHRMDAAVKAGEDINHPEVMDRLATESALDANRAIFQQNTVVSKFFSMLDRLHPAGGRAARFLFPVVKIPVNLFKEFVTYNVGAPVAAAKIGRAYWKGVETLPPVEREAIIRQLVKGSAGGAAILWGYYNSEKVHDFFASVPTFFQHTPIAMAIHEGSLIKRLEEQGSGTYYKPSEAQKEAAYAAKSSIPFMYTLTDAMDAITKPGGAEKWFYSMIQSTVVPQAVSWTAKEIDKPTPFSIFDKPAYRQPRNIVESVTQGIPGLRENIPAKEFKEKKEPSVSQRIKAKHAARTRARHKALQEP